MLKTAFADRGSINLADPANQAPDLRAVEYALLWKPDADLFARAPNLKVIFSGGAGVDHIIGMMALNPVMGASARLQVGFVGGAGFVGIAVSLMGRNHPLGIILAAILFGILYQGGDWISFEMPNITREMILVIQGLVILFAGALEYMFRPAMVRLYQQFKRG